MPSCRPPARVTVPPDAAVRLLDFAKPVGLLLDPGVVQISYWRPDAADPDPSLDRVWGFAGVASGWAYFFAMALVGRGWLLAVAG
jgi:hypothetical protein